MLHPVGPQTPGVYWVRRILAILVILALVLGLRWLLTGRSTSSDTAAPGASSSPSAGPTTPAPSSSPSASPTTSTSASPSTKPSASATGVAACADSDITVTASTDAASYSVGATPRLRMRIQNTSAKDCKRDVGAAVNELLISSGDTRVWSSDDCNTGGSAQIVTLKPDQSYSVSVTWLGRLSQKGCPADQPLAQKGTYKLVGRNGDVSSAGAVFSLT